MKKFLKIVGIIVGIIVIILVINFAIRDNTTKTTSKMTCNDLANNVKGMELSNNLGKKFKILKIYGAKQTSKSETELICTGTAKFNSGDDKKVKLSIVEDEDGDRFFGVEPY